VREGASEALSRATSRAAFGEIERLLRGKKNPYSKEAVIYAAITTIRKGFVKAYESAPELGDNIDRRREAAKNLLRKTRGLEYFSRMLPKLKEIDPEERRYQWMRFALKDPKSRVRVAALHGLLFYPHNSSIPALIENMERLQKLEKKSKKNTRLHYREQLVNRFVLEQLSGQNLGREAADWRKWWGIHKDDFSLEKRIEEELENEDTGARTVLVRTGGVEIRLNMKVAGERGGYPLVVLSWRGYEPDYFRPYFHGIEEKLRVHYLFMPQMADFKGLARGGESNIVNYPTRRLATALSEYMKEVKRERFAVLGHGPGASSLAMHLAAAHPKKVSHLIFINPASAGDRYGQALRSVQRVGRSRKNPEVVNGIEHLFVDKEGNPQYEPADSDEKVGLNRSLNNLRFADPTTPEIGSMDFLYRLPGGDMVMNDNTWSMRKLFQKPPRVPVLVCMGLLSPWAPVGDMEGVAKFFKAKVTRFTHSGEFPFIFETYDFTQAVNRFIEKNLPKKKAKRSGKKKRKRKKRS
jgi:pimeloyl-ACP methyl ester carboxylesterase